VFVVGARVVPKRRPFEIGARVQRPPLLAELGERFCTGIKVGEGVTALEHAHLRLRRTGILEAVERLGALPVARPPTDAIDRVGGAVPASALAALDHGLSL